jgi:acetoin utilization protein AcuB
MADNKIGGVPVMRDEKLVGIITETDLFKVFLELLGAREEAVRLTLQVPGEKGTLAKITGTIAEMGGNIMSMGTIKGEDPSVYLLTMRVIDVPQEELISAMEDLGMKITDQRYCELPVC